MRYQLNAQWRPSEVRFDADRGIVAGELLEENLRVDEYYFFKDFFVLTWPFRNPSRQVYTSENVAGLSALFAA